MAQTNLTSDWKSNSNESSNGKERLLDWAGVDITLLVIGEICLRKGTEFCVLKLQLKCNASSNQDVMLTFVQSVPLHKTFFPFRARDAEKIVWMTRSNELIFHFKADSIRIFDLEIKNKFVCLNHFKRSLEKFLKIGTS